MQEDGQDSSFLQKHILIYFQQHVNLSHHKGKDLSAGCSWRLLGSLEILTLKEVSVLKSQIQLSPSSVSKDFILVNIESKRALLFHCN